MLKMKFYNTEILQIEQENEYTSRSVDQMGLIATSGKRESKLKILTHFPI